MRHFIVLIVLCFLSSVVAVAADSTFEETLKRAEAGHAESQLAAGLYYAKGQEIEQDFSTARAWWDKAAQQGNPSAIYYLGLMSARGDGVEKDMQQAKQRWEVAAEKDHIGALFNLGMLYVEGETVKGDYVEAGRYFKRAAVQGNIQSQFNVSVLYSQGLGFPQSNEYSYAWARLAADQGHPNALELLKTLERQMSEDQMIVAEGEYSKIKGSLIQ